MAKRVVGFIGLGLMGRGMAGNILQKGNDLLVMAHRNRAPVDELVGAGAREVKSAREMAELGFEDALDRFDRRTRQRVHAELASSR